MATKIKMSDEEILDYIKSCFNESDESFQADTKPIMDECWDLYRITRDYSKKKDWQTKHVNPRAFASVEIGVALVKKSLIYMRDFFTVKGQEKNDRNKESLVKEGILFYLRKAKFFIKFLEGLKMAFISGLGCVKIYWKRWEEEVTAIETIKKIVPVTRNIFGIDIPIGFRQETKREEVIKTIQKSELIVESVDPALLRIDPFAKFTTRPKYIIEIEEVDWSIIKKLEDEGYYGKEANGDSVDSVQETMYASKTDEKYQYTNQEVPESGREMAQTTGTDESPSASKMEERKTVVLWHFWGDIEAEKEIDPDTKIQVYENYNIVVLNGKYIIRKKKNPHTHGKYPYIFIPCIIKPFSFYPIGLIEPIRTTLDYLDDLQNGVMDELKLALMNMFAVDVTMLEDPINDLVIEPGNFVRIKGSMGQDINTIIRKLMEVPNNLGPVLSMINYLDRIVQLASGVVDPLMGMSTKGDQTATEFRGSLSQSTIKFESIARDVEEFSLNPALEMVFQLIFQNMDREMWINITGEDGAQIDEHITPERIEGNFDFYVNTITGFLSQMEYISKMVSVWSTIIQAAQILQLTPTEARKIMKLMIKAHGLKEVDELLPDMPQMSPMMPGGPGMGGGLGEPPTGQPNPQMGPENMMQMLAGKMGGGM